MYISIVLKKHEVHERKQPHDESSLTENIRLCGFFALFRKKILTVLRRLYRFYSF